MGSESFYEEAITLFGMRVKGEIKAGDLQDPEKRKKILENLRNKKVSKNKINLNKVTNSGMEH